MKSQLVSLDEFAELMEKHLAALAFILESAKGQPDGLDIPIEEFNEVVERFRKMKAGARDGLTGILQAIADDQHEAAYTLAEELLVELEKI
ncbi:MAG: hypothetical protein H6566_29955 [Lewinellaceae bacterium]|nr:hypothetical protein [Lewinellaceae bacterium]